MFVNSHFSDLLRIFNDNSYQILVMGSSAGNDFQGKQYKP